MMKVKLNGVEKSITEKSSLKMLIDDYLKGKEPKGIAAALNGNIVPKTTWETTGLEENDSIEIVHAVQGG